MISIAFDGTYRGWRECARGLLAAHVQPEEVHWGGGLFSGDVPWTHGHVRVPRAFLEFAELVACHRDERKWPLLYRVLYRLTHGEPDLLHDAVDADVRALADLRRQVGHDIHQMKAFVRFREHGDEYVAWYQPDHDIVEKTAPWFAERFAAMRWSILTPDRSVCWDGVELRYGPGAPRSAAPDGDSREDLWRAYYASTYNPARANPHLLQQHVPSRRWGLLPELRDANALVQTIAAPRNRPVSAADFIPTDATLPVMREAIRHCRGCELWECATQPVFGVGPENAKLAFVGEQPGDNEDREGKPFVGPSGQLFDRALAEAGLNRGEIYLSGAVKHFRYEERGKRRIHKTASKAQVSACQPWILAELKLVRPKLIVCMGNTAALSIVGRGVRLLEERGVVRPHHLADGVLLTVHPGFLLRMPDPSRQAEEYARFVGDLRTAREFVAA